MNSNKDCAGNFTEGSPRIPQAVVTQRDAFQNPTTIRDVVNLEDHGAAAIAVASSAMNSLPREKKGIQR